MIISKNSKHKIRYFTTILALMLTIIFLSSCLASKVSNNQPNIYLTTEQEESIQSSSKLPEAEVNVSNTKKIEQLEIEPQVAANLENTTLDERAKLDEIDEINEKNVEINENNENEPVNNPQNFKNCDKEPSFTSDITDLSKISVIVPPINKIGNDYKTHAFIKIKSGEIAVYAPVDAIFDSGTQYLEDNRGQYILTFNVKNSCDTIQFRFDHLSKVVDKLKPYLPAIPQKDSRSLPISTIVEFKAGELVGYTIGTDLGKTWDFGVYNYQELNPFNSKEDPYYDSQIKKNGICPFKYFLDKKKYQALFRNSDGSEYKNERDLCKEI